MNHVITPPPPPSQVKISPVPAAGSTCGAGHGADDRNQQRAKRSHGLPGSDAGQCR